MNQFALDKCSNESPQNLDKKTVECASLIRYTRKALVKECVKTNRTELWLPNHQSQKLQKSA